MTEFFLVAQDEGVWGPFTSREECERLVDRDAAITGDTRAEPLEIWTREQLTEAKVPARDIWPVAIFTAYLDEEEKANS